MTLTMEERMQASLPEPPPVLSAPVVALFTNQAGFGTHCRIERSTSPFKGKPLEGEFLHRGNQFIFAAQAQEKHARGREMTFIWDAGVNGGFALNDALPGYAPILSKIQLTVTQGTGKAPVEEKVNGHPCTQELLTIALNDGSQSQITVWRATDLHGMPVRIRSDGGTARFLIDLTDVRFQEPAAKLFEIPADFTKYESPKAMFDELFRRESVTRRSNKPQRAFDEDEFIKTGRMRPEDR